MTLPQPPPVLKSFVQQLTSVQSLINFAPTTQVRLMASPTPLSTSPISSEGSTVLLSPDRDQSPDSPDHGEHTPTFPDRPGSPSHLGPARSFTTVTGSPDRRPTRPSSPARDLSPRSPGPEWYAPIVPDRPGSPSRLGLAGSTTIATGSPDRQPTRPSSPARDLSPKSPDHGRYAPIVPDRPGRGVGHGRPRGSLAQLVP